MARWGDQYRGKASGDAVTEVEISNYEPLSEEASVEYRERHALRDRRRRSAGYYTADEAADTLAEKLGIDDSLTRSVAAHNLRKAIRASVELETLCRHQWSDALGGFADPKAGKYVFAREVNAWLEQNRKPSHLRLPEPQIERSLTEEAATDVPKPADEALPAAPKGREEVPDAKGEFDEEAPRSPPRVVKHSTKTKPRNILDPVIEMAQQQCADPQDTAQVWARLEVLAEGEHPPLLAATPDGLKYKCGGNTAYLKRDALDKRLKRRR